MSTSCLENLPNIDIVCFNILIIFYHLICFGDLLQIAHHIMSHMLMTSMPRRHTHTYSLYVNILLCPLNMLNWIIHNIHIQYHSQDLIIFMSHMPLWYLNHCTYLTCLGPHFVILNIVVDIILMLNCQHHIKFWHTWHLGILSACSQLHVYLTSEHTQCAVLDPCLVDTVCSHTFSSQHQMISNSQSTSYASKIWSQHWSTISSKCSYEYLPKSSGSCMINEMLGNCPNFIVQGQHAVIDSLATFHYWATTILDLWVLKSKKGMLKHHGSSPTFNSASCHISGR